MSFARAPAVAFILALSIFSFSLEVAVSQAASPSKPISSIHISPKPDPHIACNNTGELSGAHPGWADLASQKLTVVPLGKSNYRISWCPAAAPNGYGPISYTVTSTLGAITCETTALSCVMTGISDSPKLLLTATDETGTYSDNPIAIANSGIPVTCAKVLMQCNPGPATVIFPTFGNLAPEGVGDCTFAAAANWEFLTLGIRVDPAGVIKAFNSASGGGNIGLTTNQVFNYWSTFGIGGIYAQNWNGIATDPVNLMKSIDDPDIGAVIVSLNLRKNQNFAGTSNPNPSYHWVVVDGYTPQGPLVVTWGKTLQMTWQQWNLEAVSMWQVDTIGSS